jgi:hypothetical protein
VVQDADQPGAHRRLALEAVAGRQRGEQRVLHGVLGERLVADAAAREPQHRAAVHGEIGGGVEGGD